MKKLICAVLAAVILTMPAAAVTTLTDDALSIKAPSAVLMEKESGEVIYEKGAHERRPPASVTKVMTILLIVEALERGDIALSDTVTASARAASFGGSCVYLEEGEKMSVDEMLKCITVVSANDCAVAMSEFLCGSEQSFVRKMNERAAALGMADTNFTNCTGLFDDTNHYTTAYDIALMSRELIKHDMIKKYSTIWTDSIRNGEFGLTNTNKLVTRYDGCTGLKTGFTSDAMYCLSATAERDGMELIAVIMHGGSIDDRNSDAKALLDHGFANYTVCSLRAPGVLPPVRVRLGTADSVQPVYEGEEFALIEKAGSKDISYSVELCDSVSAPVYEGDRLGTLTVTVGDKALREVPIVAGSGVDRASFFGMFTELLKIYIGIG